MTDELSRRIADLSPAKRDLLMRQLRTNQNLSAGSVIPQTSRDGNVELSFAQQRLWFFDKLESVSDTYNMPVATRIAGPLNVASLAKCLREVQRKHEILRTSFDEAGGKPFQVIGNDVDLVLRELDLSQHDHDRRESLMLTLVSEESRKVFDLRQGPLIRAALFRLGEMDHVFVVTIHHIISDAWSLSIFFQELFELYDAHENGNPKTAAPLSVQYVDFSSWQKQRLEGELFDQQLTFWRQQLADAPPVLELPTDRPRPQAQTFCGATQQLRLSKELSEKLSGMARRENATLFMVLMAGFQTLLMRYSRQEDVVVGTAVAGRSRPEFEPLIGLFANTLAIRTDLSGNPSFRELLNRVREGCLAAFSHQEFPFEKLVSELRITRSMQHTPVFQVMLTLQNVPIAEVNPAGLSLQPITTGWNVSKFDQTLFAIETADGLMLSLEYNTDLFNGSTIQRMLGHLEVLLTSMVEDPLRRIADTPLLTSQEQAQFDVWNSTRTELEQLSLPVHKIFEIQVEKTPDKPAVLGSDQTLSYTELNSRANQLAHHLIKIGVKPKSLVGLCMDRSTDLIVTILGILKTGSAYVPLDADYPDQRWQMMLADAGIDYVVSKERLLEQHEIRELQPITLDGDRDLIGESPTLNPDIGLSSDELAYVMYTSGSTGKPKGVSIPHRAIVRLVIGSDFATFGEDRVFLQLANSSFDASTFEFWGALLHGAQLVISPSRLPDPEELSLLLSRHHVTTFFLTTSLFNQLVDVRPEALSGAEEILIGGEALSASHIRKAQAVLGPNVQLINGYGPTESTTFATTYRIPWEPFCQSSSIPIGRPVSNTQTYVLDTALQPVPIGVPGELYIGGEGLALGYWKRERLTAERFVRNPFSNDSQSSLYRTGDSCRWTEDGYLEFVERLDDQVKLRGFRIELGEIESAVLEHPSLRSAVAMVREDREGDKRLVCYLIADTPRPDIDAVKSHLQQTLPAYMIPSSFVYLEEFPLTPNGKIDRSQLPRPGQSSEVNGRAQSSNNLIEKQLQTIWQKTLDIETVGILDDFFELGGHSLLALQLFSEIEATFGHRFPLDLLFRTPNIRGLAKAIRGELSGPASSSIVQVQPNGTRTPLFLVPPSTSPGIVFARLALALGADQPVYGLTPPLLDYSQPRNFFEKMATHYIREIKQIQPEGPYLLGGRCFGCFIAFEMARQLRRNGEQVKMLLMMDPGGPLVHHFQFLRFKLKVGIRNAWVNVKRVMRGKPSIRYLTIPYHDVEYNILYPETRPSASQDQLVWDANLRAASKYRMKPFDGRITLLLSGEHYSEKLVEIWRPLALDGLDTLVVEGEHEAMLKDPLVQTTARLLDSSLRSAQQLD